MDLLKGLEPMVIENRLGDSPDVRALLDHSKAVSLKRIADSLELIAGALADPNTPVNAYGEGWSEALQNSIERGLRGISVPR